MPSENPTRKTLTQGKEEEDGRGRLCETEGIYGYAACCPILKHAKLMPRPADVVLSYSQAQIDPELCSACVQCIERCQMAAIREGKDSSEMIDGRCIGCGLCASACPTEAISMVAKSGMEAPPKEFFQDTPQRIEAERRALQVKAKGEAR